MLKLGENWLEGEVPVLALPALKQIDEAILGIIADYTFRQLVLLVDVTAIRLVNTVHQAAFDSATENLAIIADEQGADSDAYKNARVAALAALAKFTHIGP